MAPFTRLLTRLFLSRGVKGDGKQAKGSSHEASGHEFIEIEQGVKLLKPGTNLLAIVGHNTRSTSSDFTLDPYLVSTNRNQQPTAKKTPLDNPASNAIASAFEQLAGGQYAAGSRRLVVFNRKTGEKLWHWDALFNFRHNNIAVTNDRLFCIDRSTDGRASDWLHYGIADAYHRCPGALRQVVFAEVDVTTKDDRASLSRRLVKPVRRH